MGGVDIPLCVYMSMCVYVYKLNFHNVFTCHWTSTLMLYLSYCTKCSYE